MTQPNTVRSRWKMILWLSKSKFIDVQGWERQKKNILVMMQCSDFLLLWAFLGGPVSPLLFFLTIYVARHFLKGVCHEIFDLQFFSWLKPIWAPDKQAKIFSNSVSISLRYSITKFEKIDFAVCSTPRSQNFRFR